MGNVHANELPQKMMLLQVSASAQEASAEQNRRYIYTWVCPVVINRLNIPEGQKWLKGTVGD